MVPRDPGHADRCVAAAGAVEESVTRGRDDRTRANEENMTEDVQPTEHEPSEITYSEQFYPARPRALRPRARLRPQGSPQHGEDRSGEPVGTNPFYVAWLQRSSMLHDANVISNQFSGTGGMWQNPYANPDPESAIASAGVWFTAYPLSLMTRPGRSFLGTRTPICGAPSSGSGSARCTPAPSSAPAG
jgi:hypothetical protein